MTINDWKLTRGSVEIAQILTFVPGIDQEKVVSKALNGSIYIQTIGDGVKYASASILANREEMDSVNWAEADGAAVSAVYRGKRYLGYIEESPEWSAIIPGEWYRANIKILIEEEAAV